MSSRPWVRQHVWALASYGLLSLLLTFPLILRFTTHVPGDGIDDPALTWNLWWVRYALLDLRSNPFASRWMFWPIGINLAFYTLTVWNGLLSIPLQLAWEVVPASNLLLLSSFVLSGYGAYLLTLQIWAGITRVRDPLALRGGAWLAGLIYAFATNKLFYASLGQFNIASSQWIPFTVLYIWRAGSARGRLKDAILAGLFLGIQAWAEATFASFLLIFIAFYALWLMVTRTGHGAWRQWGGRLALTLAVFALILAPMLANMIPDLLAEGDFFASGGGFADIFSADLAGYLMPSRLHPILKRWVEGMPFPHDKGQQVYLGYSVLALALWGMSARPRRATIFWGIATMGFFLLTLGPTWRWMGQDTGIPGPFAVVAQLPFFKGNRYPSRYAVMLLLTAAVLAGRGLMRLSIRLPGPRRRVAVGLTALAFLAEHIAIPLPLHDMRVPSLYRTIAVERDPTPGVVMELPLGWRNGARVVGKKDTIIMAVQWYQTVHHRPILGGNTSRNPEFKFQYFSEAPLLDLLIGLVNAADEPWHQALRERLKPLSAWANGEGEPPATWLAQQRALAAQVLEILDVAYVALHRARIPRELDWYVQTVFPVQKTGEEGDLVLYRVQRDPERLPTRFELSDEPSRLLLGEGWSPLDPAIGAEGVPGVWAQRREVRLYLPIYRPIRSLEMRLYAPGPGQEVALVIGSREVDRQPLSQGWNRVRWRWQPPPSLRALLPVRLRFKRLYPPEAIPSRRAGPDGIRLPASVLVRSAGEEVGDFAHIYVDGVDRSPGRRGYNLVQFDPETGQVLAAAAFDTHGDEGASQAMAAWIDAIPPGRWVLGAVKDEASLRLTAEAVTALRTLGVITDLRGRFRWSHAFIGAKGWAPGTALEQEAVLRPADVAIGPPLTRPQTAAALATIRLIPAARPSPR